LFTELNWKEYTINNGARSLCQPENLFQRLESIRLFFQAFSRLCWYFLGYHHQRSPHPLSKLVEALASSSYGDPGIAFGAIYISMFAKSGPITLKPSPSGVAVAKIFLSSVRVFGHDESAE